MCFQDCPRQSTLDATNLVPKASLNKATLRTKQLDSRAAAFHNPAMQEPSCTPEQFFGPVYPDLTMSLITRLMGGLLFAFYVFCFFWLLKQEPKKPMSKWVGITLGFWVLGPPLWFAAEYFLVNGVLRFYFYPQSPLPCPESFQYSQELASKMWVAAVAVLVAVYQKKVPGAPEG
jgi:hypothetical protein